MARPDAVMSGLEHWSGNYGKSDAIRHSFVPLQGFTASTFAVVMTSGHYFNFRRFHDFPALLFLDGARDFYLF